MVDRYDELYRSHRWSVPQRYNIAHACCGQWADDRNRFALYWEDESGAAAAYSFWDVQVAANRLSNALAGLGVKRGDRVALILPQRPETAIAYVAIFQMGAIALPLSHLFGPDALEYRLAHAGASVAVPSYLVGGCQGGAGGAGGGGGGGGAGSPGGGAVYLIAGASISNDGVIDASGAGGTVCRSCTSTSSARISGIWPITA